MGSGGLDVALPCASAKRSRLFPEVFDDCSSVGLRLSPRDRAIIREVNETVFALNMLETGCIGLSESCEEVEYSMFSTDLASLAFHRLHSVISDFRPPRVTESGEAALWRLLASRAIGGYSLTADDPAQGFADRVPLISSCSTGRLKSSLPCFTAANLSSFLRGYV